MLFRVLEETRLALIVGMSLPPGQVLRIEQYFTVCVDEINKVPLETSNKQIYHRAELEYWLIVDLDALHLRQRMCNQRWRSAIRGVRLNTGQPGPPSIPALKSVGLSRRVLDLHPQLVCVVDKPDACQTNCKLRGLSRICPAFECPSKCCWRP